MACTPQARQKVSRMRPSSSVSMICAVALAMATALAPVPAEAKRLERACLNSDRAAASRALCDCIQRVADQMLTRSDQRLAARFFKDPQRAQDVRQSDRADHEAFWKRYRDFGDSASKICEVQS